MFWRCNFFVLLFCCFGSLTSVSNAQQIERGPVTNLPLPRFVSLGGEKANMRRGPALTHRIDWVLQRRGLPLVVTAEFGSWLRVSDSEGASGWVHSILISGVRNVVVTDETLGIYPDAAVIGQPLAIAEKNVIARLRSCQSDWCEIYIDGYSGWVLKSGIWGVDDAEVNG